jgi:hypothetical protein
VRLRRILRRVRRGNAQRDDVIFRLLPEPIEEVCSMIVIPHHSFTEDDPSFTGPHPSPHGREGTPVTDGTHSEFVLDGTVGEPVDAIGGHRPDLCRDVITTSDDDVGAQISDQTFVSTGRVCDDVESVCFRKLYNVASVASGGARDCNGLAWY